MERIPEEVFNLFNLHYLGLNKTGIKEIPKSIGRLQNLQYLYALETRITEIPNELTKLQRLRVLMVAHGKPGAEDGNYIYNGIMPPKKIWKLNNLRVMTVIKATDEMVRNLETLTKLKTLDVTEIRSKHCEDLFTAISKFTLLEWLFLIANDGEVLQLQVLNTCASVIVLSGKLENTSVPQFFRSLQDHNCIRKLVLLYSWLDENSFFCLQEIRSLTSLHLAGYQGNELRFREMSFLMLQQFVLVGAPLVQLIEINQGAMPNLEKLHIDLIKGVKELPQGIEYLSKLEDFVWYNPDTTLVEGVQREREDNQVGEDRMRIIKVVKFVTY
ncbi:disease resistance protein RPM1-like [Carex rostrata]